MALSTASLRTRQVRIYFIVVYIIITSLTTAIKTNRTTSTTTRMLILLVPELSNLSDSDDFSCSHSNNRSKQLMNTVQSAINETEEWIKSNGTVHLDDLSVDTIWRDSGGCDEKTALGETVTLQKNNIDVIIGPPCPDSLRVVALLGSYWSIPIITWAPVYRHVVGQSSYGDVISTFGAFEDFSEATLQVMKFLKWTNVALILKEDGLCEHVIADLRKSILAQSWIKESKMVLLNSGNMSTIENELVKIKKLTRTIVVCMPPDSAHALMTEADLASMTSGYFAFLYLNFDVQPIKAASWRSQRNEIYGSLLQFGQFVDSNYVNRSQHKAKRSYGTTDHYLDTQVMMSPYLHDAVVMAIFAATSLRNDTKTLKDFTLAAPHLRTGPIVIDNMGIKKSTFSLVHYQHHSYVKVAIVTPDRNLILKEAMVWPAGSLPISDLTCGAPDNACADQSGNIAGAVVGVLAILAILTAAVIYYRKRIHQRISTEKDWVIEDKDVKRRKVKAALGNGIASGSIKRRLVRMETRGTLGLGSNCSLDRNMLYAPIGNYKIDIGYRVLEEM